MGVHSWVKILGNTYFHLHLNESKEHFYSNLVYFENGLSDHCSCNKVNPFKQPNLAQSLPIIVKTTILPYDSYFHWNLRPCSPKPYPHQYCFVKSWRSQSMVTYVKCNFEFYSVNWSWKSNIQYLQDKRGKNLSKIWWF